MFSKESRTKTSATVSNKYHIHAAKMHLKPQKFRSSHRSCSVKKVCNFIIRKRLQYCEVFKNTYFEKHLWAAASENQHLNHKFRSSPPEVFCKKGVLKKFAKFTVKHLSQSFLFNKVASLRLWHSCFPVNFVKFLRKPFFIEHHWWLLLQIRRRELVSDFFYPFNLLGLVPTSVIFLYRWWEHRSDNFQKLSLHLSVIYQSDNDHFFFIFTSLKYRSDMLVRRNTDHGLWSSSKFVKFCLFFIRKPFFM